MSTSLKQDIIQAARKGNCPEYKQNSHACWGCVCASFENEEYICNNVKYDKKVYKVKVRKVKKCGKRKITKV